MGDALSDRFGFGPAFVAEWKRQWGSDFADLLSAEPGTVGYLWGDFALSANLRGREMALDLAVRLSRGLPSLAGRRALDIGCGVGGTAVAMAELGAEVKGLDLDEPRILLATANAADHSVAVTFSHDDVLESAARLRLGRFDAIVAEDVLEHVADAREGTLALAELLADGGLARVTIPNGDGIPFVISDGHYLLPGLTLLRDREDAAAYYHARFDWGEYDVGNYHPYDEYRGWFGEAGLSVLGVDVIDPIDSSTLDTQLTVARRAVAAAAADGSLPERVRAALGAGWVAYEGRVAAALSHGRSGAAMRIGARSWRFYLGKGDLERRTSLRWPPRWAWRESVKRVPGAVGLVRKLRR